MRRMTALLCISLLSFVLSGCKARTMPNSREGGVISQSQSVNDVLAQRTGEEIPATIAPETVQTETPQPQSTVEYETVDIDLTDSSETMLYSEVIMITDELDSNLGKVIRIKGQYMDYHDDMSSSSYPAVIVLDATKCCATGLVFELSDGSYPGEGEEITVTGVLADFPTADSPFPLLEHAIITEG